SLEIQQGLHATRPRDPDATLDVAYNQHKLGDALADLGRTEEALEHVERACALLDEVGPGRVPARGHCALAEANACRGVFRFRRRRYDDAGASYDRARAAFEAELAEGGNGDHARSKLGGVFINLGNVQHATGRFAEAEASYRQAIALFGPLTQAHPDDT